MKTDIDISMGTGPPFASQGCPWQTCPGAVKDSREKGNGWNKNRLSPDLASPPSGEFEPGAQRKIACGKKPI